MAWYTADAEINNRVESALSSCEYGWSNWTVVKGYHENQRGVDEYMDVNGDSRVRVIKHSDGVGIVSYGGHGYLGEDTYTLKHDLQDGRLKKKDISGLE